MEEVNKKNLSYLELNEAHKRSLATIEKNKKDYNELEKVFRDMERTRNKTTEENTKLKNKVDHLL